MAEFQSWNHLHEKGEGRATHIKYIVSYKSLKFMLLYFNKEHNKIIHDLEIIIYKKNKLNPAEEIN